MEPVCVTGGDDKFFLHLLLLIASFRRHCPDRRLEVCDFGLDPRRRDYLAHHVDILPMPPALREVPAVLYRKAALIDYLAGLSCEAVMWIDTDTMLTADAPTELMDLAQQRGAELVCSAEPETIESMIARLLRKGHASASEFATLVANAGLDGALPYLNSGMFICRSREFLAAWKDTAFAIPRHVLFEQNAFNLVAHRRPGLFPVEGAEWNCLDANLPGVRRATDGRWVDERGRRVRLIHCTSDTGQFQERTITVTLNDASGRFQGWLRVLTNPALRDLQIELINIVARDLPLLAAHGLTEPSGS